MTVGTALQLSSPSLSHFLPGLRIGASCGQRGLHPESKSLCHAGTPGLQAQPTGSFPSPELKLTLSASPIS